ncbi:MULTISPECIES: hypothetical protein [unclassified Pseudomonas]|uniref:DUF6957 family protein n=1 Tax=unclassified Pseudomonas TaxID=196821 RepID=UPI00076DCF52|nr:MULTISPECIES: hypothetical protein [unclassified Pseudomonas]KVV03107.1 hypothetical protein AP060_02782 [Pseudomonas sp. TAD18]KVV05469.1 hypothetical protein AP059_02765 [Pseudomonas sp. TAA207]
MVTLEEISQLLYGAGEEVAGWRGTQNELIEFAADTFPGKAFCVVKQWILIDLTVTPTEKDKLNRAGSTSRDAFRPRNCPRQSKSLPAFDVGVQ